MCTTARCEKSRSLGDFTSPLFHCIPAALILGSALHYSALLCRFINIQQTAGRSADRCWLASAGNNGMRVAGDEDHRVPHHHHQQHCHFSGIDYRMRMCLLAGWLTALFGALLLESSTLSPVCALLAE